MMKYELIDPKDFIVRHNDFYDTEEKLIKSFYDFHRKQLLFGDNPLTIGFDEIDDILYWFPILQEFYIEILNCKIRVKIRPFDTLESFMIFDFKIEGSEYSKLREVFKTKDKTAGADMLAFMLSK